MEFKRLVKTLAFFEVIPGLACLNNIFNIFNSPEQHTPPSPSPRPMMKKNVLVVGATGRVGRLVVNLLLHQGYGVRALVRDRDRAMAIFNQHHNVSNDLEERLELVSGDLTQLEGLDPKMTEGMHHLIFCAAATTDPPQLVEYKGLEHLIKLTKHQLIPVNTHTLFDFSQPEFNLSPSWGAVDDVVMGGVSSSQISLVPGEKAIFSGVVSTANSGGFASVRSRNFVDPLDLSEYEGMRLTVKGDGNRYKFITRCAGTWDGLAYAYTFDTVPGEWRTIHIPFRQLTPVFRAKTVPEAGPFQRDSVYSLQLMLSKFEYDGHLNPHFTPGEFSLEVVDMTAYGGKSKPQLVLISATGVTGQGDRSNPSVHNHDTLTWKRAAEDLVRDSGLNYTILRPGLLTDSHTPQRLQVGQGDQLRGKVSRAAIAQLCVQCLTHSNAGYKTLEVIETNNPQPTNWEHLFKQLITDD
jgi:nucleoside-diphosphate-sugar epimerase